MHNDHIGDSLDAAKSVLLTSLASRGISTCLIPLPSHDSFDYQLFVRCVSTQDPSRIYRSRQNYTYRNHFRKHYLDELSNWLTAVESSVRAIVFDPDTGIRPDRDTNRFFGIAQLMRFIHDHPRCVIGVYQHRGTGGLSFERSLALVSAEDAFGYDFGNAAILFWAKEPAQEILERMRQMFMGCFNQKRLILKSA
jgi:hypothetical protein